MMGKRELMGELGCGLVLPVGQECEGLEDVGL